MSVQNTLAFEHFGNPQDRRVRLYDTTRNWALRKDVTTRMTRWTITGEVGWHRRGISRVGISDVSRTPCQSGLSEQGGTKAVHAAMVTEVKLP